MQSENSTEDPSPGWTPAPWFIGGLLVSTLSGIAGFFYAPIDGSTWGVETFIWLTVLITAGGIIPDLLLGVPLGQRAGLRVMAIVFGAFIGVIAAGLITALWQALRGMFQ